MQDQTVAFWLFSFAIASGVFVIVSAMKYRAKIVEMAHRERLAMIERGLKPDGALVASVSEFPRPRSSRMMSGGIIIVGFGLALATVIAFTSRETEIAIGIGGAIAILGAAFVLTAYVRYQEPARPEPEWTPSRRAGSVSPPPPPANES